MTKLASASINTFGPSPKAGFESPSEQLIQAIQEAIQPLQDRISSLEDRVTGLQEENAALRAKLASLESLQEQDTTRICLDIAYDRRRLSKLENAKEEPTDTEKEG